MAFVKYLTCHGKLHIIKLYPQMVTHTFKLGAE